MDSIPIPRSIHAEPYVLRLPEPGDESDVIAGANDESVAGWTTLPHPYGSTEFAEFLELAASGWGGRNAIHYIIVDRDQVLGACGAYLNWPTEEAEVGYWLAAEARGRGVVSVALNALTTWLHDAGFHRLFAEVMSGNDPSGRVLTRAGFTLEGTRRGVKAGRCGLGQDRIDIDMWSRLPTDP